MDSNEDFTLFPPGTNFFEPDDIHQVTIQFPTQDDAIIFFEFIKSFVSGEIKLEVTRPDS